MSETRKTWQRPWGYKESAIIAGGFLCTGALLEFATNGLFIPIPSWPANLISAIVFMVILYGLHLLSKSVYMVRWLSSIPACIGAIIVFTILVLSMGLVKQSDGSEYSYLPFGLDQIRKTWYFLFASVYLLTCLGLVTLRRSTPLNKRNIGFLVNHLGLWIIVVAASMGSGDLRRFQMQIKEGETSNLGFSNREQVVQLPFNVRLLDFSIDEFPAKIALVDYKTKMIDPKLRNNLFLLEKGKTFKLYGYKIEVVNYLPAAKEDSVQGFVPSADSFAAPVALIKIFDKNGQPYKIGFLSSGSPTASPLYLQLDSLYFLAMTLPEPKKFSSKLAVTSREGQTSYTHLLVNQPYKIDGWKIYQVGYDKEMGKYSKTSILEAVRDPWIPIVYTGIFLLIAGAAYMFWLGKEIKN